MDRLAELAGYAQSFPGMVDEDFIAAGFSPDEVYSYRINQQAQSETARARELASMQEQRRARGQALAAQYPDYFRQGLETEPLYGINQRMSDIKAGAELTQDPNFARRQFARLATDLGLPLSLTESVFGLAELTPYGSFASGFDVAASIPQTAEYLREGEYGRAALSGAGGFLAALDVIGASLPITVPAARVVSKIDTGKLAADVVGTGRALVDMDLEFLLGRGDPALAQGVGADVPGRPPLTFDEVEAAMKAETLAPQGIKAYQGSPHNFAAERLVRYPDGSTEYIVGSPDVLPDIPAGAEVLEDFPLGRMRMDKIGTGEGAQAYGPGIYAAENEGVAREYRNALSDTVMTPDGTPDLEKRAAQMALTFSDNTPEGAIAWLAKFKNGANHTSPAMTPELIDAVSARFRSGDFKPGGSMYEVNIAANPDDFLDWDAPLSAQPAARKLGIPSQVELDDLTSEIRALEARGANASDADMTTLEGFFNAPWKNPELHEEWAAKIEARNQMLRAQDTYGGDVPSLVRASNYTPGLPGTRDGVAKHLMERGIPGIKYLDQGSRNTSGGEILGVQKTADGWTAKIRVDDRGGTGFQTPTQSVTTKKGFATEAEAMDWAKGKVSSGSRNFVVFDEKLISIVKKYGIAGAATMLGVSALDVEQALADNLAPSDWEDLVAGPVVETVSSIKEKYPLFSDIEVRDLRDQGVQDGRRLEFTEAYDDRYDKPLIEIFDPALQGDELEQAIIGEFLHEAPRRIPEYAKLREKLQKLKTPQQLQDDMNSYLYDVENYGENRPFEKWDEVSRKDAFIRGHAVGQWEPEYYTDEQKALIDEMMGLIRSGANK